MSAQPMTWRKSRTQTGMSLIEVLVALVLISVGLLGVAALQLTSLKGNQESYIRAQASTLADYILDRMRTNQAGVAGGQYDVTFNGTGTAGTAAGNDLGRWQAEINRLMPGGDTNAAGQVERNGSIVTITIRWGERADRVLGGGAGNVQFQIRTEV